MTNVGEKESGLMRNKQLKSIERIFEAVGW